MPYREEIARDKGIDHTLAFLREGYLYISNRAKKYDRNMFHTRLLGGKPTVCLIGKEAAEMFYDETKTKREGAAPARVLKTLFGEDGVQTLDGDAHEHRKEMFMSLMTKERLQDIRDIFKIEWQRALNRWEGKKEIQLYDEAKKVLTSTACKWAGVPLPADTKTKETEQLSALFEAGGAIGIRHLKGRRDRQQQEDWAEALILSVRQGEIQAEEETALSVIAFHEDQDGNRLDAKIAAVELVNILRPIVAISVYITFCALALHEFPQARNKLENGTATDYRNFVQEVRRYYPFFPMTVAKVQEDFLWNGHDFKKDTMLLLDLYGTNHDSNTWKNPEQFMPERFADWEGSPFDFIPQGGGDYNQNHRCPGEWLTIYIMETCLDMLLHGMHYDVPEQNLQYSMTKMPSLPKSNFRMTHIQSADI